MAAPMSGIQKPLLAPADGVVEGKRWVVLLVFSWIEFNQVHTVARTLPPPCAEAARAA